MQKTLFSTLALGLAVASLPTHAQSSLTVYGVVDAGLVFEHGGASGSTQTLSGGAGSGSRLGFKGKEDLGGGLSIGFALESGLTLDTGASGQGGVLFGRQAYVSVSGASGTLSAGRQYSPYFKAMRDAGDPFVAGFAGNAFNIFSANARVDNSIEYTTPQLAGFSADVLVGLGETPGNSASNRALGAAINYNRGPLRVVLAHHQQNDVSNSTHSRNTILATRLRLGNVTGHATYARNQDMFGSDSRDALLGLSVAAGPGNLMLSYIDHRGTTAEQPRARQVALGYVYTLSVRTDVYGAYGHIVNRNGADFHVGNSTDAGSGTSAFNLGLRHVF